MNSNIFYKTCKNISIYNKKKDWIILSGVVSLSEDDLFIKHEEVTTYELRTDFDRRKILKLNVQDALTLLQWLLQG